MTKKRSPSSSDEDNANSRTRGNDDELTERQGQPKAESLYQINRALIRMLMMLSEAGDVGMYTRELLDRMGSVAYGQKMLKLGEDKGYIKRVRNIKPDGKGNYRVMNYLTPKGKQLVKKWTEAINENNNNNNNN